MVESTQALRVRPAAVAGRFYPRDPVELRKTVRELLLAARATIPAITGIGPIKAIIVPHAGYAYSGPTAAAAYAALQAQRGAITRVVLVGPSHFVPISGIAAPSVEAFATPLGEVAIDRRALDDAAALPFVLTFDDAHAQEHSLEVHLPFLQEALGGFTLAPFVFGDASAAQLAQLLRLLWDGPQTLVVVSSDLSHYQDYATARQIDMATCAAIEHLRPDQISEPQACGRPAVQGLLHEARERGLRSTTLDLRNSGDTAGSRSRVVGYGAWALT